MQFHNKAPFLFRPAQVIRRLCRYLGKPPAGLVKVVLPWRLALDVNPHETIGRTVWNTGVHDLAVCEILCRLAQPGEVAVDIGANIGIMSSLLAVSVGENGKVFSFEPHTDLCPRLHANAASWMATKGVAQIIVGQVAISSAEGTAFLVAGPDFANNEGTASLKKAGSAAEPGKTVAIQTTTLAKALAGYPKVGVVKIDVEGHESEVFQGSLDLLSQRALRDIVFEDSTGAIAQIAELLWSHGYSIYLIEETLLRPVLKPIRNPEELRLGYAYANYLATAEPERVMRLLDKAGWSALRFKVSA